MRPNRLRQILDAGEPSIGTHAVMVWPGVAEIIGHAGGIDYVEFVAEYGPYDLFALENFARAVDLFDHMSSMMKVEQEPRTYLAVRALGSGIQNILFADPRTPDDVRQCVQAVRAETPATGGLHGAGSRRDVRYGVEGGSEAFVEALERAVVAIMIEKEAAVRDLEALLGVGGVDMVQFGPTDYSMSIGAPGQGFDNAKVREAEDYVIKTALQMGIQPRAEIGDPDQAKAYLDRGVRHFSIGTDISILRSYWRANGAALRDAIAGH